MKKYILIITALFLLNTNNSCSERDLDLFPPQADEIANINTEDQLQQILNGAYLTASSVNVFGTKATLFGDIMADKVFVSLQNPSFLDTFNYNFSALQQQEFSGLYGGLYNTILRCNLVINNTNVPSSDKTVRMKGEAKILRGLAYFTLTNFFSPSPTSGVNQEYGVPIVLGNYDVNIQPARSTVAAVYDQIIADLKEGIEGADAMPSSKTLLGKDAGRLILSRVYLTRRAAGDAQLALDAATEVINVAKTVDAFNVVPGVPINLSTYTNYFASSNSTLSEEQPETVWELDLSSSTNLVNGIGANLSLPGFYNRIDAKRCLLINQTLYGSLADTDVRKGSPTTGLLITVGTPNVDTPKGYWTNKYPRLTDEGNYFRNIKLLRFSEAYLNRIEALNLLGQTGAALDELNAFATSRRGVTYTGADLQNDILEERAKEFYAEGQRFFDLKRYNLGLNRPSNCLVTCTIAPNDKLFVLPMSAGALNANESLTQYPGY